MHITLVTGSRNSGKTTWCRDNLPGAGGSLAIKIFEAQTHIGYDALRPRTGETTPLLRLTPTPSSSPSTTGERTGRFTVLQEGFRQSADWIRNARPGEAVIIDEIGAYELSGHGYHSVLLELLEHSSPIHLYLVVRREYLHEVRANFRLPVDAAIIDATDNRD